MTLSRPQLNGNNVRRSTDGSDGSAQKTLDDFDKVTHNAE